MWVMKQRYPGWVWAASFSIVIVLTVWAVSYYSRDTSAGPPERGKPRTMPVEAVPVRIGTVTQEVNTVGTLNAKEAVVIRSEIAGRVKKIHFSEGQKVKSGSTLIDLDPSEYLAQVERIRATVRLNQLNFDRAKQLHAEKMISPSAYDEAEARLSESKANLALAQARLDKTTIRAPFGGQLGLRQISPGDYLQPGQAIVNLEDISSIKLDFRVPEIYFGQVRTGQTARVRVDAFLGQTFRGRIYAIDPRIDTNTRTLLLRARIPNTGGKLRPGMFARVSLVLDKRPNAVLIPEQALVPMGETKMVYRIVEGKAVRTLVTVGQRRDGEVEISKGLGSEDIVVTGGQTKLFDGVSVMILPPGGEKPEPSPARKP